MRVAISGVGRTCRKELTERLQAEGHSVLHIGTKDISEPGYVFAPLERVNTNPFKEIKAIRALAKSLKDHQIQALIAYGIRTFPAMVISGKLAGVRRVVCVVNGSGRLFRLRGFRGFLTRAVALPMIWLAFFLSNGVLFQNPDDLKMAYSGRLLWRHNYGLVNGSGVNLEHFQVVPLPDEPVFLMVGRLTRHKGVNEYLKASMIVKEKYPQAQFYLVGPLDDDDRGLDVELLKEATSRGIVNMIGKVSDVRPYIEKCRVFVLPSYHEGTPRTVLEAMAMGRPIITTNVPGCKETVVEGENGFKVPFKDIDTLVKKIIWMIEHPREMEKMGANSRMICEAKFDVHEVNNTIVKFLLG